MANLTCNEINVNLNNALQKALVGTAEKFKGYVDVTVGDAKSELKEQIVAELSNVDGLGEQLEKIQAMADAFSKAFDGNADGAITPEEILAKAVLLQQAIDGVNGRVDAVNASVTEVKEACDAEIEELKNRVTAVEGNLAKANDEIAGIKAELATNVVTKEYIECATAIDLDTLLAAVGEVFEPKTEEEGDGATL